MSKRATSFSSFSVENGLHQAAALSSMTLLVTAHRAIMNTGFTLRRHGLSTDAFVALAVGVIATIWSALVIASGVFIGQRPCLSGVEVCLARLAYAPWMMSLLFVFWAVAYAHELLYIAAKERTIKIGNSRDEESTGRQKAASMIDRILCSNWLRLWRMKSSRGALDWSGSVDWKFKLAMFLTMVSAVGITAFGAIWTKLYTVGMLNLVGLALFMLGAGGSNRYTAAPHLYTADMLRVVLDTRHKEGTVYILPYKGRGFDAVWSPKIDYEYREVDEGSPLSSQPNAEVKVRAKGHLRDFSLRLAAFNSATEMTASEVKDLAIWLYTPRSAPKEMKRIACIRAPGIHLMGHSLMSALWHAEYLVFMQRHLLDSDLVRLVGTLRGSRTTGMDIEKGARQIGNRPGLEGYQEAVRYIYSLFDEPVDSNALVPTSKPPISSEVMSVCPETIEGYVAALWDHCILTQESTFAALYAFCYFWMLDIGNDSVNGWHGFPLRSRDREGDIVSWHVIWRQAWYGAVIAQLTSMSPIILSAFVAGILQ